MKSGDIVTFPASRYRWTIVEAYPSPSSQIMWRLIRKGTDAHESAAESTSEVKAEGGLDYVESPTFEPDELIFNETNRGRVLSDVGADLVPCLMEGGDKPLSQGDDIWQGEGLKGIPDGDVRVAIDPGVELVPRWLLVLRNRL